MEVFEVVSDDVDFLKEETHAYGEVFALDKADIFAARFVEEVAEAETDEAGDVVAVLVVIGDGDTLCVADVLGHSCAHFFGDVPDDFLVLFVETEEAVDDDVVLFQ